MNSSVSPCKGLLGCSSLIKRKPALGARRQYCYDGWAIYRPNKASTLHQRGTVMKLLIRNLNRTTSEEQMKALFDGFGTVQSCNLVMDKLTGGSKGFGFVEMPSNGEAKDAIKGLNNSELDGNKIRVKKAEDKG
jgi:RNA recognition motif-containing protein